MSPEYNKKSFYILIIKGDFGISPYFRMVLSQFFFFKDWEPNKLSPKEEGKSSETTKEDHIILKNLGVKSADNRKV